MQPASKRTAQIVVACCVVGWLVILGASQSRPAAVDSRPPVPVVPDWRDSALHSLSLSFSWEKSGFGTVMLATFRLKNAGNIEILDPEITCIGHGASGTAIDRSVKIAYVRVPAHKTTVIRGLNMGLIDSQVTSEECSLTDFSID